MTKDRKLLSFFIQKARCHRKRYLAGFSIIPVASGLAMVAPLFLQRAIDDGIRAGRTDIVFSATGLFLVCTLAHLLFLTLQNILIQKAGIRTLQDVRSTVVKKICHVSRSRFERVPLGVFVSRATSDIEAVGESLSFALVGILTDVAIILGIAAVLLYQDPVIGSRILLLVPLLTMLIEVIRRRVRGLHEHIRSLTGKMSGQLNEAITMRHEIQIFHLRKRLSSDFSESNLDFRNTSIRSISLAALTVSIIEGAKYLGIGILILSSLSVARETSLTPGEIVKYIGYLNLLFAPFVRLGQRFNALQSSFAALTKIDQVMAYEQPADHGTSHVGRCDLTVRDLCFRYHPENRDVLQNIDFSLSQGHSLAIVGPTGSGKSSMVKLIARIHEVSQGQICLGGFDIRDIPRADLKKLIALVPQDPVIFNGTISENICLFRPEISQEQIRQICRDVKADQFISSLPKGYDTMLDSEGSTLSMGQRQLIALARALISDAEILIFDESTANIDTETERAIQQAQQYVMQHKTAILIAHRLSTIRHVDHILVLQDGKIVQRGKHDELVSQPGVYRTLYTLEQT